MTDGGDQPDEGAADDRFDQLDLIERQLLLAPVHSTTDVAAKLNFLARIAGDGERSDGADVICIRDLASWMDARFGVNAVADRTDRHAGQVRT
ncbi:hypothetical protein [Brevundimonas sp.]|uniref:hypothetical protein n=1 Tax=Brevundimonas sp. TaxID=1871086 RepID=UPI003D0C9810